MSKDPEPPAPNPSPADIEIEVVNPRYEGATPIMVAKALLQRPKKKDKKGDTHLLAKNEDVEDADSST